MLLKSCIQAKMLPLSTFTSFEYMDMSLVTANTNIHLIVIYRPPPSMKNCLTPDMFFKEFTTFMEGILISQGKLIILGDFNFHIDNAANTTASRFLNLIESFNLKQHVVGSTHQSGHTFDLVITRAGESLVDD